MALVRKTLIKLDIPHEPDQWVELELPLSGGNYENGISLSEIVSSAITAWSYDIPVTPANVAGQDPATYNWLLSEVGARSGLRGREEKKDSSSNSTTPSTDEASSLVTSST